VSDATRPLADVYWDVMLDEPLELEPFLRRAAAGEWGAYAAADIRDFLRQIEQDILGSIATRSGSMGVRPGEAEARAEETRQMIQGLIRRYAAGV
jgi:hypothetical protein